MKNLHINLVDFYHEDVFQGCESFMEDCSSQCIFIAKNEEVIAWNYGSKEMIWRVSWAEEREGAKLVDFHFLYDSAELAATFTNGSLLLLNTETQEITKECVGCECRAASWNPDLTSLAVSDGFAVTLYDRMLEGIQSRELNTDERGKDEQVTVGWGSKETQFQGSVGKAAREKKEEDKTAYEDDSGDHYIRWRADGQLFVVSFRSDENNERRTLVFDNNGELLSHLKIEQSMEEVVAVKTIGNSIATTKRNHDGARQLVFFERNGEKRHEYSLKTTSEEKLVGLAWDVSGTILMMHYMGKEVDRLEMWVVSNYDWNLKWAHIFRSRISRCHWDPEKAMVFSLVTEDGSFARLFFSHKYCSPGTIACVVSNDGFRMTNFARAPIPPPMSEYVIPSPPPLCFSFDGCSLVALEIYGTLKLYKTGSTGRLELTKEFSVDLSPIGRVFSSAALLGEDFYVVVNGATIWRINVASGSTSDVTNFRLPTSSPIVELCSVDSQLVAVTADGSFHRFAGSWEEISRISPSAFVDVKCSKNDILALTSSNELFLNGQQVASSVSSFLVADNVCMYITLQNKIHFADITNKFSSLSEDRAVELGSQLVCCVPEKMSLVQQMPRGNLETIYPRIFVVRVIRSQIASFKYVEALRTMKKHRVNMNLLVDHDFNAFIDNVHLLFDDSSDPDIVNLLIASLTNDLSEWCSGKPAEAKVEKVTTLLQEEVLRLEISQRLDFFTVLLSALLKHFPPRVESALQYIKQHTDEMNPSERDAFSRHWLHHVGFFVDEKSMFNAALATYDLHLTVQVAEASNRDPKEYLPLLNELRKIEPEQYRRYKIQIVREDWTAALAELAQLPEKFDEAVALIKNKNLYSNALKVFRNKENYATICEVVAGYLELKGQWNEAALLYKKAGNTEKILLCLEMSRNVPSLMTAAAQLQVSSETLRPRLIKMALLLENDGKWLKSAEAHRLAGASSKKVVEVLVKGCEWSKAVSEARDDMDAVRELAISRADQLTTEISSRREILTLRASRLESVRETKDKRIQNLKEGIECGRDFEDIDAFSEAGSTLSMLSRRTGKTGSSRASTTATMRKRKQIERKKQSLKEGGEYEDSALLLDLHEQYKWINNTSTEVRKLLSALAELDEFSLASQLQNSLDKLCQEAKTRQIHIWPSKLQAKHLCGPLPVIYTVNDIFAFPEDGGMPSVVVIEPEMIPPPPVDISSWKLACLL